MLHCRSSADCRTLVPSQALVVELTGHVCALQTRQQVSRCQRHHDASRGVGGASDMWQHNCTRQEWTGKDAEGETPGKCKYKYTGRLLTAVFQCKEGVVRRKGLGRCYIKSSRSHLSRSQSLVEVFLVHHGSPEQRRFHSVFTRIKSVMPIWSQGSQDLLEFTKTAVFLILLKNSLLHIPCVSGVREQEMTMKSLSARSVSRGTVGVSKHKDSGDHTWG